MKMYQSNQIVLIFFILLIAGACTDIPEPTAPVVKAEAMLVMTTSDFTTGFFSAISLTDLKVYKDIFPVHSDAVVKSTGGEIFVLNRYGADNLVKVSPWENFRPVYEVSLGNKSNPQNIALVSPSLAYVSLHNRDYLSAIDPRNGKTVGTLSVSAWSDSDGYPEPSALFTDGTILYVTLQRLNRNSGGVWQPSGDSRLLAFDASNKSIMADYILPFENPVSSLRKHPVDNSLYVSAPANFGVNYSLDGGVVLFNVSTSTFGASPLPEAAAGLEILNSIFVSKTLAFAIASDQIFQSYLIAFDPESGTVLHTLAVLTSSDGGYFADFAWDGSDKIFVADRSNNQPGIRIFSVTTFAEITSNPLDTGLPPYSLDIWRP